MMWLGSWFMLMRRCRRGDERAADHQRRAALQCETEYYNIANGPLAVVLAAGGNRAADALARSGPKLLGARSCPSILAA